MSTGAVRLVADCEAAVGRLWEQGANTWSSVAYLVVAIVVVVGVRRHRLPVFVLVIAAATAAEGIGSILFHGRSGDVSHAVHDLPLFALAGAISGWHAGRLTGRPHRVSVAGAAGVFVIGSVVWSIERGVTSVIVGVALAVIVVTDLLARRRGLAPIGSPGLVTLAVAAIAAWAFGRSDSPICAPESPLQLHAVWHVLSALLILAWVDRACALDGSGRRLRMFRRTTDRIIGLVAKGLVRAFHRSVDIVGGERIPRHQPVLLVANHGNGFVDPVVVAAVLGRVPRFLAKAALWKVVPARPALALAGILPVYRASDGDDVSSNDRTFAAAWGELALGSTVAIFPEGTTGDRAGLDRVRTGAARLALGGLASAPDLVVLPVGLAFESRVESRSRAVVMVGEPIHVEEWFEHWRATTDHAREEAAALPHDAVRALTEQVRVALEAVSPEFASVDERELLRAAARVATVEVAGQRQSTFGDVERLARQLAGAPGAAREQVVAAYRRYATRLLLLGLTDDDVLPRRRSVARLVGALAVLAFFGPIVVSATLIHLPALLLVVGATGMVTSTATKGTVRLLVGLVAGLATWVAAGLIASDGLGAVVVAATTALGGVVALATWTTVRQAIARLRGALRRRDRVALVSFALVDRAELLAVIAASLPEASGDRAAIEHAHDRATHELTDELTHQLGGTAIAGGDDDVRD